MRGTTIDRAPPNEVVARGDGYGVLIASVAVIEIPDPCFVEGIEVVEMRVVDVDVIPIRRSAVVPRVERFTPAKRDPAEAAAQAKTNTNAEASAEEADKRRSINGWRPNRAWTPAPIPSIPAPAAVVVRSEAPRRVIHPRPAPRADVAPIA